MSRDIIIHYDEAQGKIVCSTVEHDATASLLAEALPLETSIESFRAKCPDEAEKSLGAGIFALLDLSSKIKIGIRDYTADTTEWESELKAELEQKSVVGDATAQFELAMSLITEGLLTKSKSKMNEADALLRNAVTSGNTEAKEYFTNLWPSLKERADISFN